MPLLFNLLFLLDSCNAQSLQNQHSTGSSGFQLLQFLNEQEAHNDLWLHVYETELYPPARQAS